MKSFIITSVALCALASAAPATKTRRHDILTGTALLEIQTAPNTFSAGIDITIGAVLDTDMETLSIRIISTADVVDPSIIVCEAREQSTVVGTFTIAEIVTFPELQFITSISCSDDGSIGLLASSPPPAATSIAPVEPAPPADEPVCGCDSPEVVIEFEIAPNTFSVDQVIILGAVVDTEIELVSARIASVTGAQNEDKVVCTATKDFSSTTAGTFTLAEAAVFDNGKFAMITSIRCEEFDA